MPKTIITSVWDGGDKPIPPSVQEEIISAITKRGALPPLEFDKYIEEGMVGER